MKTFISPASYIIPLYILFTQFFCFADNTKLINLSHSDSLYIALVGKADTAIANSNWIEAENALLCAMRGQPSNPANVLLLSNLSIIRFQQGKDSLALATINDAINIAPKSITALNNRAKILKNIGRIDEAYADYETILNIDSTLIEPRYMHGIIALSNHNYSIAYNDFLLLERTAPNDELAIDGMAMYYFHTNDFISAIPYLSQLIDINPSLDNYTSLILCYLYTDQLSEASSQITNAMELYPLDGNIYLYRALLNHKYYRHTDCDADLKRALELGVPSNEVNAWRKLIYNSN